MKMSGKKCIYMRDKNGSDEDDSDPKIFFQPGADVKYKEIPTNGAEYLLKVKKEREKCAVVTKYDKDYSQLARNQTYFVEEELRATVPDKLKPTIEWQNVQIADFSELRMYLSQLTANKSKWPKSVKKIKFEYNDPIEWKNFFKKSEPTLSCLFGLRYTVYDRGLEMITALLNDVEPGHTISHETGQWIYALLACTRQPLQSESASILRDLARKCAEIRSHLNEEEEHAVEAVAPLNLFICIVARYFGQHDLGD